jgi:hypothetical protein
MFHAKSTARKVSKEKYSSEESPSAQIIAVKNKPHKLVIGRRARLLSFSQCHIGHRVAKRKKVEAEETDEHQKIQASSFNSINIMAHS